MLRSVVGEGLERVVTSAEVDAATSVAAAEMALARERSEAGMAVKVTAAGRLGGPAGEFSIGLGVDSRLLAPTANARFVPVGGTGAGSSLSLGLEVTVPIGAADVATLDAAAARLARAVLAREAVRVDALAEIDRQSRSVELASHRAEFAQMALDDRLKELVDSEARHRLGLVTSVDLAASRLAVARAARDVRRADDAVVLARLELAIARGHVPMRELVALQGGE